MNNLTNTAKKLDRVFEIVHTVLGALAIACVVLVALIGLSYVLKMDPSSVGANYNALTFGFLELEIADSVAPNQWLVLLQLSILLIVGGRLCFDGRKGVGYIREILQPMKEEKPFDSIVSTNLKKLARLSINLGILVNIILLSEQIMTVYIYDVPNLLLNDKITHVTAMYDVDLTFLVFWAIFTLLRYVFQYGESLQQLSDETL